MVLGNWKQTWHSLDDHHDFRKSEHIKFPLNTRDIFSWSHAGGE